MKSQLRELFWKVWWNTPWCVINRNAKVRQARKVFDYEKNKDISIIAANCIGGELYSVLGLQFTSPFINCSIERNNFVILASQFSAYMQGEIRDFFRNQRGELTCRLFAEGLTPIEIAWPHDQDPEQIIRNFEKRRARINYEKLVFITDDIGLSDESYQLFDKLAAYKKVIISTGFCDRNYDFIEKLKVNSARGLQYKTLSGIFRFQVLWDFVSWFNK